MRKKRLISLKRALGFRGRLSTVEKSQFRGVKKAYNGLSKGSREKFIDILYNAGIEKMKEQNAN